MRVLIVPEDFRKDQYILKPLFERLFRRLGRGSARVRVCQNPLLGGIDQALRSERLKEVVDLYPMVDLFVLCVDRDGEKGRRERLDEIERELGAECTFLAENAWEELETWMLAGLDLPAAWNWSAVRAEVSVKERYFDRLAEERGVADAPGGGRSPLGEEAARHIEAIRRKCPDDFDSLARRIEACVAAD